MSRIHPTPISRRFRRRAAAARSVRVDAVLAPAQCADADAKPEKGAKLRVLRWSRFVQGDIDAVHGERQEVHR